jgi:hypothetical protein
MSKNNKIIKNIKVIEHADDSMNYQYGKTDLPLCPQTDNLPSGTQLGNFDDKCGCNQPQVKLHALGVDSTTKNTGTVYFCSK